MQPSTDSRTDVLKPKAVRHLVVRGHKEWAAFGLFVAELTTELGWGSGVVYEGHVLRKKRATWLLVVKARDKTGPVVAFFEAATPIDCFRYLYEQLYKKHIKWVKSKY